jgi:hypothetical protein
MDSGRRRSRPPAPADVLGDGEGLTGERRLIDVEVVHLQQPEVRRHALARLQQHQVAGHDLVGRNDRRVAGAEPWP